MNRSAASRHRVMPTVGFHNAEVCEKWLWFSATGFLLQLLFGRVRSLTAYSTEAAVRWRKPWKIFLAKCWPNSTEEFVCTCIMIYLFRNVERRMGSKRFANFMLYSIVCSGLVELLALTLMYTDVGQVPFQAVAVGPFSSLASCLVLYVAICGEQFRCEDLSRRFFLVSYILLQVVRMVLLDKAVMFSLLSGAVASVLYLYNILRVQSWTIITDRMIDVIRWLSPPNPLFTRGALPGYVLPMGATESAQQDQLYEWTENYNIIRQMMQQQRRDVQSNNEPLAASARWFRSLFRTGGAAADRAAVNVSEDSVQTLMSMGFNDRQRVVEVLRDVDNDLNIAALILSQDVNDS